jgi:nanoRNase/pAp phosphatase (c-di-AMP/oligoRNAs hydrolase)
LNYEREILDNLTSLLDGNIYVLCHHNADPDSICSAYGIQQLAKVLNVSANPVIVAPGGISRLSKKIILALKIEVLENSPITDIDTIVMVDTATLHQLGEWSTKVESSKKPIIFIDHHPPHPSTSGFSTIQIIDESASSTCEIIYQLFVDLGFSVTKKIAKALLLGIVYDSRHFKIATSKTLYSVAKLLEINGPIQQVIELLSTEIDQSEKVARLKAAKRMRILDIGGWTIATSNISSFQASAARALLTLGADLSIVAGDKKNNLRASLRSSEKFFMNTNIHLGKDLAFKLGNIFNGSGNGHSTAAGINGIGDHEDLLNKAKI